METAYINSKLVKMIPFRRLVHSFGVRDTAARLAKQHGFDMEKAVVAGLLHDCAKGFSAEEQLRLCREYGIELDEVTLACPAVIHAPLGAEVARREFGIDDEEILNAIRYHTVARAGMTPIEKIVYLADMIEPMRSFDGVDKLRSRAYKNLDEGFLEALNQSISFNLEKNSVIHPDTLNARNDMLIRKGRTVDGN